MHYLDRTRVPAPSALANYGARHVWRDVTATDRAAIRDALGQLQLKRCAYCERPLENESKSPHIEHFVQRSKDPSLTFDWSNLFWSCSQLGHCGKHKDRNDVVESYLSTDLLKPDALDPRRFLQFRESGAVRPREGLSAADARRASETIRVFNLDAWTLRTARLAYLSEPQRLADEAMAATNDPDEVAALLAGYADDYRGSAYEAAILDMLGVP